MTTATREMAINMALTNTYPLCLYNMWLDSWFISGAIKDVEKCCDCTAAHMFSERQNRVNRAAFH